MPENSSDNERMIHNHCHGEYDSGTARSDNYSSSINIYAFQLFSSSDVHIPRIDSRLGTCYDKEWSQLR